jgi:hypothetical protein
VQWDAVFVRLLDPRTGELLREHLGQKRGGHRIRDRDRPRRTPQHTHQLLARAHKAVTNIGALCEAIHQRQARLAVEPQDESQSGLRSGYGRLGRTARGRAVPRTTRQRQEHIAQAIGHAVIQQGYRVMYRETHALLEELTDATLDGQRKQHMELLTTVPLLIIDDLGMRKLPLTAAEGLLEIIMRRYERASTLLASNRPVEDRGKLLGDYNPNTRPQALSLKRVSNDSIRALQTHPAAR